MLSVEHRPALLEFTAGRLRLAVIGAVKVGPLHRRTMSHLRLRLAVIGAIKVGPLHWWALSHLALRAAVLTIEIWPPVLALSLHGTRATLVWRGLWRWAISLFAALIVGAFALAALFALWADCAEFVRVDLAVRVAVEFAQTFHGFVDFGSVDIAVVVGVDHPEKSRERATGVARRAVGSGLVLCVQRDA